MLLRSNEAAAAARAMPALSAVMVQAPAEKMQ
jgi:hypothetical protein